MLGDPTECRTYGFRCETLAADSASDVIKQSLIELSRIWFGLAEAIEQTELLISLESLKAKGPNGT
jgi:hypothetical protein